MSGRRTPAGGHRYPRSARLNETLREVIADELVRIDDDVYVIGDECSHEDYSLAEGEVFTREKEIECWKHGSTFSLESGAAQCLPATAPVPVYQAGVDGDQVWVELS